MPTERNPNLFVEHAVETLVMQRIVGIALGYEDPIDHDELRVLDAHGKPPKQITLDLDATDDPLRGHQEGRFFHGYYDCCCYLPLYVFCGRPLLAAVTSTGGLRRSNIDAAAGSVEEIARIGLAYTQFATATCNTIRLKLLKIGAQVRSSVRRISIAMASACPWQYEFALAHAMLRKAGA